MSCTCNQAQRCRSEEVSMGVDLSFSFHFFHISLLSVLFSINSVQLQILYIDCCLEKNQRNFLKPSQLTSDSKMSPQTSNTIHRTDSVNAKCGFFQEIVKFAPHSTLLLIPQLPGHLLPFHLQQLCPTINNTKTNQLLHVIIEDKSYLRKYNILITL